MPTTPTNGKICYVEIPALDIRRSADFYAKVFGWRIRKRGDGSTAFDDATGAVSGAWVTGRKAWPDPPHPTRNAATATPTTVARIIFPLYGGNVLASPGVWFPACASVRQCPPG